MEGVVVCFILAFAMLGLYYFNQPKKAKLTTVVEDKSPLAAVVEVAEQERISPALRAAVIASRTEAAPQRKPAQKTQTHAAKSYTSSGGSTPVDTHHTHHYDDYDSGVDSTPTRSYSSSSCSSSYSSSSSSDSSSSSSSCD